MLQHMFNYLVFIFILRGSLSGSFYYSVSIFPHLSTQQTRYLKPRSSQLAAPLLASMWQQTVTDTALPVISPVGLPKLLYDGQADLAGSDTERSVNTADALRFIEKISSYQLHREEEAD